MSIDLVNSNISSSAGVRVSNVYSQDTTFNSITPISKALAVNGDIKMLQDATVYTDKLGTSVAQNVTVNNDMVINPANKLTATNIDAIAINNVNNPYGLRVLTDESTITSGQNIIMTPNNLLQVYTPIQCDNYQPLTIGGDITLAMTTLAKVVTNNLQLNTITAPISSDLILATTTTDLSRYVKVFNLQTNRITSPMDDELIITTLDPTKYIKIINSTGILLQSGAILISGTGNNNSVGISGDSVSIDGTNNIYLGLINTGTITVRNNGIKFGTTGNALLNAYEVNTYTGTFSNMTTTATSFTIRFTKIGNVVTVSLDTPAVFSQLTNTAGASFNVTIDSKYRRSVDVILSTVVQDTGGGYTPFRIRISVLGNLTIMSPSNVLNILYLLTFNGSYIVP